MSLNEEFDELARRKLEERQFGFQEEDWQAARKLIDAERGGRNRAVWIAGALVLLLVSGLVWYGTRPSEQKNAVAAMEQAAPRTVEVSVTDQQVQNNSATTTEAPPKANEPAMAMELKTPSIQSIPVHPVDRVPKASATNTARAGKNGAHTEYATRSEVKSKEATSPSEITGPAPGVQAGTQSLTHPGKETDQAGTIDPEVKTTQQNTVGSSVTSSTIADQPDEAIVQTGNNNADVELIATEGRTPTVDIASKVAPKSIARASTCDAF